MATRTEFLTELQDQGQGLSEQLAEIAKATGDHTNTLAELKTKRATRIDELVDTLLPSLDPPVIAELLHTLPDFVSTGLVPKLLRQTEETLQARRAELSREFDPATYEARHVDLEARLADARSAAEEVEGPFNDLRASTAVERLTENRYGTARYQPHWYGFLSRDWSYFRDWEDADKVMAWFRVGTWREAAQEYNDRRTALETLIANRDELATQLRALVTAPESLAAVTEELKHVPETVLTRLRTKLRGRLDGIDPVPAWMSDIAALDAQAARVQTELGSLREVQGNLMTEHGSLNRTLQQVNGSRRGEIDDRYMEALQANRRPAVPFGSFSSPTDVHDYYSNYRPMAAGFFGGVLFDEMLQDLSRSARAPRSGTSRGSDPSWSNDTFSSGRNDLSGQS